MRGRVIIVPADPTKAVTSEPRDKQPELEELHRIVGGYIELVPHWHEHNEQPCVVWCNEEGKLAIHGRDPLPVNMRATMMWAHALGMSPADLSRQDVLVGDICIVVNLPDEVETEEV